MSDSRATDPDEPKLWEEGWEGHSLSQLRRLAKLSLPEKLDWLEEAQRLVNHLKRSADSAADASKK